jgi:hypothetical protein
MMVDRLPNGLGLCRYIWGDQLYSRRFVPDPIVRGADGFLRIKYARLGTRLLTWDEWAAKSRREATVASARTALQAPRARSPDQLLAD